MPQTTNFQLPPRLSESMLEITETSRPEEALEIIIKDYLEEKIKEKRKELKKFEKKWGMNFEEFKEKTKKNELPEEKSIYSQEVEEDYREWEAAITLLKKYNKIRKTFI